jgi:hypothetical protein
MMIQKLLCSAVLLCGTLYVSLPSAPAKMPGPGGVIQTMREFLQALDKSDFKMLDLLVGEDDVREGCVVVPDKTAKIGIKERKGDGVSRFFEVSADGRPVRAKDKNGFLKLLRKHVTSSQVETRFHTIRADCPSEWCSYAVVEFVRTYTIDGVKQKPVPMQATALVRYVKRKDAKIPHFEIFHWHASPAARKVQATEATGK